MLKRLPIMLATIAMLSAGGLTALNAADRARAQGAVQEVAAREQTAIFTVENMTCALCPVTVKKAMAGVPGVSAVAVDFEAKTATVKFNPATVTPDEIAAAAANAGYPAKPAG